MPARGSWATKVRAHWDKPTGLYKEIGKDAVRLTKLGFQTSTDPYGKRWRPRVIGGGRPLVRSGTLSRSYRVQLRARGFTLATGDRKAKFHQYGTGLFGKRRQRIFPTKKKALRLGNTGIFAKSVKGTPVRLMIPNGNRLPQAWRKSHDDVARKYAAKLAK